MEKLELKHIAPYLPYGLMCEVTDKGKKTIAKLSGAYIDSSYAFFDTVESEHGYEGIKPILRPYSDLTDEFLEKLFNGLALDVIRTKYALIINIQIMGEWFKEIISFRKYNGENQLSMSADLYNKLIENHFDVFGLIDKGLAIDINTLK